MDTLGWIHTIDETLVQSYSYVAFLGIAVALLGRNGSRHLLRRVALRGSDDGNVHAQPRPGGLPARALAGNLTEMIQGLVVLFVGAELLVLGVWNARRKLGPAAGREHRERPTPKPHARDGALGRRPGSGSSGSASASSRSGSPFTPGRPDGFSAHRRRRDGALLGVGALTRGERRIGWGAVASSLIGIAAGAAATQASTQHLDDAVRWSASCPARSG